MLTDFQNYKIFKLSLNIVHWSCPNTQGIYKMKLIHLIYHMDTLAIDLDQFYPDIDPHLSSFWSFPVSKSSLILKEIKPEVQIKLKYYIPNLYIMCTKIPGKKHKIIELINIYIDPL